MAWRNGGASDAMSGAWDMELGGLSSSDYQKKERPTLNMGGTFDGSQGERTCRNEPLPFCLLALTLAGKFILSCCSGVPSAIAEPASLGFEHILKARISLGIL